MSSLHVIVFSLLLISVVYGDCWIGQKKGEHNISTDFATCPSEWITKARGLTLVNPPAVPSVDPYTKGPVSTAGVCGATLLNSTHYQLGTFKDVKSFPPKTYLTHNHACGLCSSFQDLSIYMQYPDMTNPVRKCALKGIVSKKWAMKCI